MAVAKGNVVDADELIAHIKSIVNTFCDGATNSGVGRVWSGQSTGIQWTGTKTDVDNSINEAIEQFKLT